MWVQFSDARSGGSPIYGIGTTSALLVNLATTSAATSLNNWGWQDGAYWLSQATTITFAASGTHTIRVQVSAVGGLPGVPYQVDPATHGGQVCAIPQLLGHAINCELGNIAWVRGQLPRGTATAGRHADITGTLQFSQAGSVAAPATGWLGFRRLNP